jgi:hypothetical protein
MSKYSQYQSNGTVSWAVFDANQATNQQKVVTVNNADFIFGTLRITVPCAIKITEDIVFNPDNGGSNPYFDPMLSSNSGKYTSNAYRSVWTYYTPKL